MIAITSKTCDEDGFLAWKKIKFIYRNLSGIMPFVKFFLCSYLCCGELLINVKCSLFSCSLLTIRPPCCRWLAKRQKRLFKCIQRRSARHGCTFFIYQFYLFKIIYYPLYTLEWSLEKNWSSLYFSRHSESRHTEYCAYDYIYIAYI